MNIKTSYCFIIHFFLVVQSLTGQNINEVYDVSKADLIWEESEGLRRIWTQGQYYFVDSENVIRLSLLDYTMVEDFSFGLAPFRHKNRKYGVLNKAGEEVISPEWDDIIGCHGGYMAVSTHKNKWVREDKAAGKSDRPVEQWYLIKCENLYTIPFPFRQVLNIQGNVIAEDLAGNELKINTTYINEWYYHPLMKAIEEVNGQEVFYEVNEPKSTIDYFTLDSLQVLSIGFATH